MQNFCADPPVAKNAPVADEIKYTTCYMYACRCGIKVSLRDGAIRYIKGNRRHPVNKGVLCAKGSAGIMQHYSPARLRKPLLRTGPRGSGEFREIEWKRRWPRRRNGWGRSAPATRKSSPFSPDAINRRP
jgi:anaerobic selenocysteine-containing dehydrogenase